VAWNFQHVHWCIPDQPLPAYIIIYLGYLKNKNETAERNATSVLYKEILEMEEKRPKQDKYLGKEYPDLTTVMTHDFSSSWIKFLCRQSKDYLMQIHEPSNMKQIEESVLDLIGENTIENLATLKASSAIN
jgi:hypothetical protein